MVKEVALSNMTMQKSRTIKGKISFYKQLLQVSVGNFAVIYDIQDAKAPKEVSYLENMTQFMMKDGFVSTGFDLYSSHN